MQLGMNAEAAGRARHAPGPDFRREPCRHRVDRLRESIAQADALALIDAGIVPRRPAGDGGRPVIGDRVRRIRAFERGEPDEGLEGRSRAGGGLRAARSNGLVWSVAPADQGA